HPKWDSLTWVDQLMGVYTKKIFNIDDLINACANDVITNGRTLDFLTIFGHGMAGYQSIGAGKKCEWSGTKSLRWIPITKPGESQLTGPAEKKLMKLNGLLSQNATVFLAGCNVGEGDNGTGLLRGVSTILNNRPIQAFEWQVFWWTGLLAGPLKEVRGTTVNSSLSTYSL
ncbi:hypothetical protein JZU46_03425, partial [bacterium]|nr:hypothetical protein [bacterium]